MLGSKQVRSGVRQALLSTAAIAALGLSTASAVTRTWIDAGADDNWSTTGNWAAGGVAVAGDLAVFGDGTTSAPVANTAQTVTVNGTITLSGLQFSNTGNRTYTLNGDTSAALLRLTGNFDLTNATSGGPFAAVTFNVGLQAGNAGTLGVTGTAALSLGSSNTTYNGDFTQEDPVDTGNVSFSGAGTNYINGQNLMTGNTTFATTAEWVVNNTNAFGDRKVRVGATGLTPTLSMAVDYTFGRVDTVDTTFTTATDLNTGGFVFRAYGPQPANGIRTITFNSRVTGSTATIGENPDGSSALRVRLLANTSYSPTWVTRADTIIEMGAVNATTPQSTGQNLAGQSMGGMSGAGRLEVTGVGRHLMGAGFTHTGGTFIYAGELRLSGSTSEAPGTGEFHVGEAGWFSVNGRTTPLGKLTGDGTVYLSNDEDTTKPPVAGTINVAEGIAPGSGSSLGSLEINGTGDVNLAGTSVFQLGARGGPQDVVTIGANATLTLGGGLFILNTGQLEIGEYTLFDLNGGAVDGAFEWIDASEGFNGRIDTSSGDVVLVVGVPEPGMISVIGLAGLALMRRRRAK